MDKPENILALLKIAKQVPTLKRIVLTKKLPDEKETEIRNKAQELNIEIVLFNQLRVSEKNLLKSVFNLFSNQSIGLSKPVPHHVSTSYFYQHQQQILFSRPNLMIYSKSVTPAVPLAYRRVPC